MIMRFKNLKGFKQIKPSQGSYSLDNYTFNVNKSGRMHPNHKIFSHFHGHQYFSFAIKDNLLAMIEVEPKQPNAIKMNIGTHGHSRFYSGFANKAVYNVIHKYINGKACVLTAKPENVYTNCVIFNLDHAKNVK